jgi:lycopene beta-cyclase
VRHDVVLVGGGLASGLAALALRRRRPELRLALVEASDRIGGNHTWSFHDSDVDDDGRALLAPLVSRRWPAVRAAFPDHQRILPTGYSSIRSPDLDAAVRQAVGTVILGARARAVTPGRVELDDGRSLEAPLIVDARGPRTCDESAAFQKFVGLEVTLDRDWPEDLPTVMDATVPQHDGYRFFYVLPFTRRRVLVEETFYSDGPALPDHGIAAFLAERGLCMTSVVREERGVLPLPLTAFRLPPLGSPLRLGYQGGWLHPTTGFSLPVATAVAGALAGGGIAAVAALYRRLSPAIRFCLGLNRLLFRAVPADRRWSVFSRFYRLPRPTIERFYALAPSAADRARLLCGRPPAGLSLAAAYAAVQGG